MAMQMDLEGFVEGNIQLVPNSPQKCLLPLFEAVSNSIHSIQAKRTSDSDSKGTIKIVIHRDLNQSTIQFQTDQSSDVSPIEGFTVRDNGVGFTDAHQKSFETGFTRLKRHLGAKGRGRFVWLKVFKTVSIESVFEEGGQKYKRAFIFSIRDGCKGGKKVPASNLDVETEVRLKDMSNSFKENCPKQLDSIAGHLVRRFVHELALPDCPTITIRDGEGGHPVSLNDLFRDIRVKGETRKFTVKGQDFEIDHLLLKKSGDLKHELHLCAHKQAVAAELLDSKISDLRAPLYENSDQVVYHGYVKGGFLDQTVNPERTDFDRVGEQELPFKESIPWNEIVRSSVSESAEFLGPYLIRVREEKERRVADYVQNEAFWYRHVLKRRPDIVSSIPPDASKSEIDIALYQGSKSIEVELRIKASQLLEGEAPSDDPNDYHVKLVEFLEEYGEVGKDQLAKYVSHRKAILMYLTERLNLREDGEYHLEEDIHQVIFPMRTTSDDIDPDRMNLWIIDERLAFHFYLASDLPLKSLKHVDIDSKDELDIIIFDRPFLFSEGRAEVDIGAAVIIEFKRPMTDNKDPIRQVFRYARKLRKGTVTKDGASFTIKDGTPLYAYILCDLTPKMREYATDASLQIMPDGHGYFGYNPTYRMYVEMISYSKAISDARKRNAILFEKLNIPVDLYKQPPNRKLTTNGAEKAPKERQVT